MKNYILTILFVICVSYTCSGQTDSVKLYVESNINYLRYWGKLQFTPKGDSIRRTLVPNFDERKQLFEKSVGEIGLTDEELETLADLTGEKHNDNLAFSFSDIRLRVLPEAVSKCFPSKALDFKSIRETITQLKPSPKII